MKRAAAFVLGIMLLASSRLAFGQGSVVFNNNIATRITNCFDRLPQARTIFVQLYCTPDLSAATDSSALASIGVNDACRSAEYSFSARLVQWW